jgi:hypothetical protein
LSRAALTGSERVDGETVWQAFAADYGCQIHFQSVFQQRIEQETGFAYAEKDIHSAFAPGIEENTCAKFFRV